MQQLGWCRAAHEEEPVVKVPLTFNYPPVELISKELTKLNSSYPYRIVYLGPRWETSLEFHRKYGNLQDSYPFDQRRVNRSSTFMQDSMNSNQYYRNEMYYRAFEGVNPTLDKSQEILFQSRFESGNLDCAVRVSDQEYDLFLRIDSNTRGNIFWYYFALRNGRAGKKIRLNICNLTKPNTHYQKGLYPFILAHDMWTQEGISEVTFSEKKIRYSFIYDRIKVSTFYELSFIVEFQDQKEVRLAYCIPYTYSTLLKELNDLSSMPQVEVASLGQSLSGLNIPIVLFGKIDTNTNKQMVLITGRIHPSESNSSLMISSLMKYLSTSRQAKYLRERLLILVVPMLNPDGVVFGNSRCGASGKDLNRQFKTRSKFLFPEVVMLKKLVDKIMDTHKLELYLDFHGHSKKKNMFIFGPNYSISQPEYYKCRIFPKILSGLTPIFRYYSCNYQIPVQKQSTARSVMLNELYVPFVYTIETSLGFYHDYVEHKDIPFSLSKWEENGEVVVLALKEYYEELEQYDLFLQNKKKTKKQFIEDIKSGTSSPLIPIGKPKASKESKKDAKDIKLLRLYQQIKELQRKQKEVQKEAGQADEDWDSDSHDQDEDLEKEKLREFTGMVTEFFEDEYKRKWEEKKPILPEKSQHSPTNENIKRKRLRLKQQRESKMREDEQILCEVLEQAKMVKQKRQELRTECKIRNDFTSIRKNGESPSEQMVEHQIKLKGDQRQRYIISNQYFQEEGSPELYKKKPSKMNIKMFNFSRIISNQRDQCNNFRQEESVQQQQTQGKRARKGFLGRNLEGIVKRGTDIHTDIEDSGRKRKPVQKLMKEKLCSNYPDDIGYYSQQGSSQHEDKTSGSDCKDEDYVFKRHDVKLRTTKGQLCFPPSFYRIKYHKSQRKRHQAMRDIKFVDYKQYHRIQNQSILINLSGNIVQDEERRKVLEQDKEDLFIKIQRFPAI